MLQISVEAATAGEDRHPMTLKSSIPNFWNNLSSLRGTSCIVALITVSTIAVPFLMMADNAVQYTLLQLADEYHMRWSKTRRFRRNVDGNYW